jgi:hypothetical protein
MEEKKRKPSSDQSQQRRSVGLRVSRDNNGVWGESRYVRRTRVDFGFATVIYLCKDESIPSS